MRSAEIIRAFDAVGKKWTAQVKAEEKRSAAHGYRASMWTVPRTPLSDICFEHMEAAWAKASGDGRLPTHWRQVFYVMRPLCDAESDRPLTDTTFKNILENYLSEHAPSWDVLRGARGVFKEPHRAEDDTGLAMSTMNVRNYLRGEPDTSIAPVSSRFPTRGAANRIAAVLICEKEGFDELLMAEGVPERFDVALMSTKGISAVAARDLARSLGAPCFTLHDLDKNGFVMASGFPFATDIGIRLADVEKWNLTPEDQAHKNPIKTASNLRRNGATADEAEFVSNGQRVELNMFSGPAFIEFVEGKLAEYGIEKVIPGDATLAEAWTRGHLAQTINTLIDIVQSDEASFEHVNDRALLTSRRDIPLMPTDLADRIREEFTTDDTLSWDEALWHIVEETS